MLMGSQSSFIYASPNRRRAHSWQMQKKTWKTEQKINQEPLLWLFCNGGGSNPRLWPCSTTEVHPQPKLTISVDLKHNPMTLLCMSHPSNSKNHTTMLYLVQSILGSDYVNSDSHITDLKGSKAKTLKGTFQMGMVTHTLISQHWGGRGSWIFEWEAMLFYNPMPVLAWGPYDTTSGSCADLIG